MSFKNSHSRNRVQCLQFNFKNVIMFFSGLDQVINLGKYDLEQTQTYYTFLCHLLKNAEVVKI